MPQDKRDADRVDDRGRAYAGSQLQMQIYVNRRRDELNKAIAAALPSLPALKHKLTWCSPIESTKYVEYLDEAFLVAVGQAHLADALRNFWPKSGPRWDGLAAAHLEGQKPPTGVLLVEGKSHVPEVYGSGCQATAASRAKIEKALDAAKKWLGVAPEADWLGPLYQSANRLAHLYFFREIAKVPAWLVNVCFTDDPTSQSPTTMVHWKAGQERIKSELGLEGIALPHCADVYLPGRARAELLG